MSNSGPLLPVLSIAISPSAVTSLEAVRRIKQTPGPNWSTHIVWTHVHAPQRLNLRTCVLGKGTPVLKQKRMVYWQRDAGLAMYCTRGPRRYTPCAQCSATLTASVAASRSQSVYPAKSTDEVKKRPLVTWCSYACVSLPTSRLCLIARSKSAGR